MIAALAVAAVALAFYAIGLLILRDCAPLELTEEQWESLADAIEQGDDHPLDPLLDGRPVVVRAALNDDGRRP